ncbi:GGDEF domain-containing protein [Rhodoferax sp.]|uniref:GGDEF domain-containing protein n=1 Tax=Rhodoferax sp. TaxID=50421 RepID=UPI002630CCB9|nr:GGDEF domain-containing protein [Rhodoferax sp.]MDD5002211.1 GGDEF domain-containing protein [Thiomonas arsenitoxydans]MDD5479077.1 GGDEF domain-containing protein [Rhodoferax sp.]
MLNLWKQLLLWHGQHNLVAAQAMQDNMARLPWVLGVVQLLLAAGIYLAWGVNASTSPAEAHFSNLIGWVDVALMLGLLVVLVWLLWCQRSACMSVWRQGLPVFLAVVFVSFGITLSIASQWVLPSATMYVISCVFVGTLLLIRPSIMLVIFGVSYAVFFWLLGQTAQTGTVLILLRFHGGMAAALGLTLSLVLWRRHTVTELLRRQVQAQNTTLALQKTQLEALSQRDSLTGLLNRRAFTDQAHTVLSRTLRDGLPLAAVMFDLDHFKQVNDEHGHPAGDAVIQFMAQVIASSVRDSDLAARVGGEEFMLLLPATGAQAAQGVAEKIRRQVAQAAVAAGTAKPLNITVSAGVAAWEPGQMSGFEDLYAAADRALYAAKHAGRNQVVCADASEIILKIGL